MILYWRPQKTYQGREKNDFLNIDADKLTLWSIDIDQNQLSNEGFSMEERLTNDIKLKISADTVGATFSNVEGTNVRVIVGVPVVTGKL